MSGLQPVGWMGGTEGCGGDSRWEEKEVLRMGQQRRGLEGTESMLAPSPPGYPRQQPTPITRPQSLPGHNRFIVEQAPRCSPGGTAQERVGWRLGAKRVLRSRPGLLGSWAPLLPLDLEKCQSIWEWATVKGGFWLALPWAERAPRAWGMW